MPQDMFVAVFYGVLDTTNHTFTCASGVHEPLVIYSRQCQCATTIDITGRLVGNGPGITYDERVVQIEPGDVLTVYTYGVTEPLHRFSLPVIR